MYYTKTDRDKAEDLRTIMEMQGVTKNVILQELEYYIDGSRLLEIYEDMANTFDIELD